MSQFESSMTSRYGTRQNIAGQARQMAEGARGYLGQGYQGAEELVASHPAASALVAFGVGLGIGLLLGSSIAHSTDRRRSAAWVDRRKAEKFGRQMLDSLVDFLPEPLASRLGS
jgi:hypothetical protein